MPSNHKIPEGDKSWVWAESTIPVTKEEMLTYVGEPCPDIDEDCPTCKSWAQFKATGKITVLIERDDLWKALFQR